MTSIPEAYSEEREEVVDPEFAWELSLQGKLKGRTAFRCGGAGCKARVSLVNFGRPLDEIEHTPYFRRHKTTEHSAFCPYQFDDGSGPKDLDQFREERESSEKKPKGLPDYANFTDPKGGGGEEREGPTGPRKPAERNYDLHYRGMPRVAAHYAILRRDGLLDDHVLSLHKQKLTYREWFVSAFSRVGQIEALTEPRIIWATVFVSRGKRPGYWISFQTARRTAEQGHFIKAWLSDEVLDLNEYGHSLRRKFEELLEDKKKAKALGFVYGFPVKKKGTSDKPEFQIWVSNPREVELAPRSMFVEMGCRDE